MLSHEEVNSLGMAWFALLCPTVLPPVAVTTTGHFILERREEREGKGRGRLCEEETKRLRKEAAHTQAPRAH